MKNTTTIIADREATTYFCRLQPVQAKKVLFEMSLLKGDKRLGDSGIAEVRRIAGFYEGVICASFAKELAALLAEGYNKVHSGVLMTKKHAEAYTDARYRKLYDALGLYGFDYVITALELGKAYVANPANGIDERHMLNALRWEERREGVDAMTSNDRHRRKGIQLVGLGDMMEPLLPHTFAIANVYELVSPRPQTYTVPEREAAQEPAAEPERLTILDMVYHIHKNSDLLKEFYATSKPAVPEGYAEDELVEGSVTYGLAKSNLLKDPEAVLQYVEQKKRYEDCVKRLSEVFAEIEVKYILEKEEIIKRFLDLVELF